MRTNRESHLANKSWGVTLATRLPDGSIEMPLSTGRGNPAISISVVFYGLDTPLDQLDRTVKDRLIRFPPNAKQISRGTGSLLREWSSKRVLKCKRADVLVWVQKGSRVEYFLSSPLSEERNPSKHVRIASWRQGSLEGDRQLRKEQPNLSGNLGTEADGYMLFLSQTAEEETTWWMRLGNTIEASIVGNPGIETLIQLATFDMFAPDRGSLWLLGPGLTSSSSSVTEQVTDLEVDAARDVMHRARALEMERLSGKDRMPAQTPTPAGHLQYPLSSDSLSRAWVPGNIVAVMRTEKGTDSRRKKNEDSIEIAIPGDDEPKGSLFVLADGVGGGNLGEQASASAVTHVIQHYYSATEPSTTTLGVIKSAFHDSSLDIAAINEGLPSDKRSYTTCLAVAVLANEAHVVWLGDSQAFLIRGGQVVVATARGEYTSQDGRSAPYVLGFTDHISQIMADTWPLAGSDIIVLTSDGLTAVVPPMEIAQLLSTWLPTANITESQVQKAVVRLFELAGTRKHTDDASCIVVCQGASAKVVVGPRKVQVITDEKTVTGKSAPRFISPRLIAFCLLVLLAILITYLIQKQFLSGFEPKPSTATPHEVTSILSPTPSSTLPPLIAPLIPTSTPTPTSTPSLTPTSTPSPTSSPTRTPRPTRTPTSRPTPVPTPVPVVLTAPVPVPTDQSFVADSDLKEIVFRWDPPANRPANALVQLLVEYLPDNLPAVEILRESTDQNEMKVPIQKFTQRGRFQWRLRQVITAVPQQKEGDWSQPVEFRIDNPSQSVEPTPTRCPPFICPP